MKPEKAELVLKACVEDIKSWITSNCLLKQTFFLGFLNFPGIDRIRSVDQITLDQGRANFLTWATVGFKSDRQAGPGADGVFWFSIL